MITRKTLALGIAGGALALVAPLGLVSAANAADPTPTPNPSASSNWGPGMGMGGRFGGGGAGMRNGAGYGATALADYLAEKLGVDAAKVTEALTGYHATNLPTTRGFDMSDEQQAAQHKELAAYLAPKLGVDAAKIEAALNGMQADRQADRTAQLKATLAERVKAGTITQEQADAILAAHANADGPLRMGPGMNGKAGGMGRMGGGPRWNTAPTT